MTKQQRPLRYNLFNLLPKHIQTFQFQSNILATLSEPTLGQPMLSHMGLSPRPMKQTLNQALSTLTSPIPSSDPFRLQCEEAVRLSQSYTHFFNIAFSKGNQNG
jgi:hypothetical protein